MSVREYTGKILKELTDNLWYVNDEQLDHLTNVILSANHIFTAGAGRSGLTDDDFRIAVKRGICKVNIFTDLEKAGKAGAEKALAEGVSGMTGMIPYEIEAMKQVVEEKIRLFGSAGKA